MQCAVKANHFFHTILVFCRGNWASARCNDSSPIPQSHRNPTSGCRAKPTMTLECLLSEKHCRVTCPASQLTLLVTTTYDDMLFGSRIALPDFTVAAPMSISVNTQTWMTLLRAIWVLVALMIVT